MRSDRAPEEVGVILVRPGFFFLLTNSLTKPSARLLPRQRWKTEIGSVTGLARMGGARIERATSCL
jgi:hypothetical protein